MDCEFYFDLRGMDSTEFLVVLSLIAAVVWCMVIAGIWLRGGNGD